jgi:3-oxoacyl-[acyl-carrier protein] reductase
MNTPTAFVAPELAIVTGAGRGIGRAIALDLARHGSEVLCISKSASCVETVDKVRCAGGKADSIQLDLAQYSYVGEPISRWLDRNHARKIAIVLAGGSLGPSGTLASTHLEDWELAWRTNVLGNLAVVQACLPRLVANRYGRVLFFAGGGAAYAYPLFPAYAMTKTALVRVVENLHEDLKTSGDIAVAILAPGAVDTQMLATVRQAGGEVRTMVPISEPVAFVRSFVSAPQCGFSGCFVHVRDAWQPLLENAAAIPQKDLWKLRRVE